MSRVLIVASTTGYQTRMFGEAAERLGVTLVFATDRCDQLDDPWWDSAVPIRFHEEDASAEAIVRACAQPPIDGVLTVGDRGTVIAALVAARLGIPAHRPEAAAAARDKRLTRERLHAAGLPSPWFVTVPRAADPRALAPQLALPAVVKPVSLAGSRGVIRADTPAAFVEAFERLQTLLASAEVRAMRDPATDVIQIEGYIAGREYALEGLLQHGELQTLAIFDKPEPLEGPFFEETIYVTPSRASDEDQTAIRAGVAAAARALGLVHGPVHAECRIGAEGVFVLEVAARPIGGLCADALAFVDAAGTRVGLEGLLLRHARGESMAGWSREPQASGVMMIPIPRGGIYRSVAGVDHAEKIPGVEHVRITAKPDQRLVPLPEGASYLGFIFARAETPAEVEHALRAAHTRLSFTIEREVPVMPGGARRD